MKNVDQKSKFWRKLKKLIINRNFSGKKKHSREVLTNKKNEILAKIKKNILEKF